MGTSLTSPWDEAEGLTLLSFFSPGTGIKHANMGVRVNTNVEGTSLSLVHYGKATGASCLCWKRNADSAWPKTMPNEKI
ncbi:hypothetical protein M378DRAFT_463848 [Amanita muscaria Koide BX008]|uniref:Uncharacterized protein n=1 Tax=Amanita muscaria (strain Koide BX008) TaxID=946122 RepID=A0A0C2X904_AMAMK|nr:hypothetical protein M378DRAFT_463848 [Amanita muscaria Koide BX008]